MHRILILLDVFGQRSRTNLAGFVVGVLTVFCLGSPGLAQVCDLNGDGQCGNDDLRVLYDDIDALAGPGPSDLNNDGVVDNNDIPSWLSEAGFNNIGAPYLPGDADLSGCVTGTDFLIWQQNSGATGLPLAYWEHANFDGNVGGFNVSSVDMQTWSAHYGQCSVPEPNTCWLLAAGGFFALARTNQKRSGMQPSRRRTVS